MKMSFFNWYSYDTMFTIKKPWFFYEHFAEILKHFVENCIIENKSKDVHSPYFRR